MQKSLEKGLEMFFDDENNELLNEIFEPPNFGLESIMSIDGKGMFKAYFYKDWKSK